jgi:CO dehydrogenase/acetyl-CoA synthase alpha subunit
VGCSNIACSLEVRGSLLLLPAIKKDVRGSVAHCLSLVPEALHVAQEFNAPVLQPDDRERVVYAARCTQCGRVCPLEMAEGAIAGGI